MKIRDENYFEYHKLFVIFCIFLLALSSGSCEETQNITIHDLAEESESDDIAETQNIIEGNCPVTYYEVCGGDLIGEWSFLSLCPEDVEAGAALCESPYDDREECIGEGNEASCDGTTKGTLNFKENGEVEFETEISLTSTWRFTDECLDSVGREPQPAEEHCLGMNNERLTCEYTPGSCQCESAPMVETDSGTAEYQVSNNEIIIGEDPPSTYCIQGDILIMDYYLFHPVSWRYWILERL